MIRKIKKLLFKLYKGSKVKLNYLFDRIIDICDLILMDIYTVSHPGLRKGLHVVARFIGNVSALLRNFPQMSAYKLVGPDWIIVFVGGNAGKIEIRELFFGDDVELLEIGRVPAWKLSKHARNWLSEDADLVVCELSAVYPNRPKAAITFRVPDWINQSLKLPEPLEKLLSGKCMKGVRHNLNRAAKANFSWHFSEDQADFDEFHYQMYLPYIKNRYADRAMVASYQDQWQRWFTNGGLIMVTQEQTNVGGLLCYLRNKTFFAVEMGVLDSRSDLISQGVKISSDWFAMQWAKQKGARIYNMGGTRPWCTDGVFMHKSRWRPKVIKRAKIYDEWVFLADTLSPSLQNYMNDIALISNVDNSFFRIMIDSKTKPVTKDCIQKLLIKADRAGLDGVAVIAPNVEPTLHFHE